MIRAVKLPLALPLALLLGYGCAGELSDPEKQAAAILERAHDLMGGQALIDSIHTMQVTAASMYRSVR